MSTYKLFHKTPDKKTDKCECPNGHTWIEWFFKYPSSNDKSITLGYDYASSNGSTCPECGEQDILNH